VRLRRPAKTAKPGRGCLSIEVLPSIVLLVGAAVFFCWVLTLRFGDFTCWAWLYKFVPGARALRALTRFDLVFYFVITAAILHRLHGWYTRSPSPRRALIVGAALLLLGVEQVNLARNTGADKTALRASLSKIPPPPNGTAWFYLDPAPFVPASGSTFGDACRYQTFAMLAACHLALPTINGYSGVFPKDWRFFGPDDPNSRREMRQWLLRKNLPTSVAVLNPVTGSWRQDNFDDFPALGLPLTLAFSGPESRAFLGNGWSFPEPIGTWSDGDASEIILPLADKNLPARLIVNLGLAAFLHDKHPLQECEIRIGGIRRGLVAFSPDNNGKTVPIAVDRAELTANHTLWIELRHRRPMQPSRVIAGNNDTRRLGVLLKEVTVAATE
jgi:hypothetical protein